MLGGVVAVTVYFGITYAADKIDIADLPSGVHGEEIDGMIHQVEYHYGSPMYYNVDGMLKNQSVETYPEDIISYFPDPTLGIGSQIVIKRANEVMVVDAGKEKTYRTWTNNIAQFLVEKNIEVGEMDIVNPNKDQNFSQLFTMNDRVVVARDGREESVSWRTNPVVAKIEITRVAVTEVKEYEEINYKTITREDASLERGIIKTEQDGKKGKKELVYEVRRENGAEVNRKLIRTEVVKEPQEKIVIKGTKVVVYGTGKATWYSLIGGNTAAHNTLPKGTIVHVVNLENGKSVDVKIVDRGIQGSAIIDLSDDAFKLIAPLGKGVVQVRLEKM
ncbi:MAG: hypothetical protein ACD_58C00084G0001 [uncultured bacterium]|nr:MAG: hypothetical protein ACD_58C00084G0001 [uncultured bacterium]